GLQDLACPEPVPLLDALGQLPIGDQEGSPALLAGRGQLLLAQQPGRPVGPPLVDDRRHPLQHRVHAHTPAPLRPGRASSACPPAKPSSPTLPKKTRRPPWKPVTSQDPPPPAPSAAAAGSPVNSPAHLSWARPY